MKALVSHFKESPQWTDFTDPKTESDEVIVNVSAVALTNLVKGQSNGTHYSVKGDSIPFVPGDEGTGRMENGQRVFFFSKRKPFGSLAEKTVVKREFLIPLPDDLDDVSAASISNPAMSSWAALTRRALLKPGETVLINGATGISGQMAIRIAKHLGARRVIVTGRKESNPDKLISLGADEVITLGDGFNERITAVIEEISIVLDYLWGSSAESIINTVGNTHSDRPVRYVQIGTIAGTTINMPAFPLRASGLVMMGTGLGSVSNLELLKVISEAFQVAKKIGLTVDATAIPMSEGEKIWTEHRNDRVVFTL
ncbi:quinone oxidoreductase family protein [Legionella fallonii]|uniref:NADPH:quinone reductase n=1 Tax=Legionella fallonii LLAP-10 TaxID=1212491 RepID=A0A098G4A2_9GAMM|nr:zinc-binding alcohol dehydrogenase family protein [Legionella fallonii]CEG56310.1 NADPH:quinone reductase [Legionella fallonii LLAP-10]